MLGGVARVLVHRWTSIGHSQKGHDVNLTLSLRRANGRCNLVDPNDC